jgi:hypothetical protein
MRRLGIAALLITSFAMSFAGQQQPASWSEWSQKEAVRILSDSPWAQTQIETDTTEMTYSPTSRDASSSMGIPGVGPSTSSTTGPSLPGTRSDQRRIASSRAIEGAYNRPVGITYWVRFLSAKPVREALAKIIVMEQGRPGSERQHLVNERLKVQMQEFVDRNFGEYIVVAVAFDADDGRLLGKVFQDFGSAAAETIKNNTYLERKDGKRLFLMDYRAPIQDGLGAKFIFPRTLDGAAFLDTDSGEVRFYSEVGRNVKLNRRFKISEMIYQGKLEY